MIIEGVNFVRQVARELAAYFASSEYCKTKTEFDYDGCCIYSYYGKIRINSDGKDGKEIDVEALGYLEGYQEHKEESGAGE